MHRYHDQGPQLFHYSRGFLGFYDPWWWKWIPKSRVKNRFPSLRMKVRLARWRDFRSMKRKSLEVDSSAKHWIMMAQVLIVIQKFSLRYSKVCNVQLKSTINGRGQAQGMKDYWEYIGSFLSTRLTRKQKFLWLRNLIQVRSQQQSKKVSTAGKEYAAQKA